MLTHSERDGDELAHRISAALADHRGGSGIKVATHGAQVGQLRHVALTIESPSSLREVLWAVLSDISSEVGAGTGMLVAGHYAGVPELCGPLIAAVAAHTGRRSGRVVTFPGSDLLTGTMTVQAVQDSSAIDRVRVLASGDADPTAELLTRDFVRPRWSDRELVLDTQPARGGTLVLFETPDPTPCCLAHTWAPR